MGSTLRGLATLAWLVAGGCFTAEQVEAGVVGNPLMAIDRQIDRTPFEGIAVEVRSAGSYTYLRVETAERTRWVVGLDKGVAAGQPVRITPVGLAREFESGRTGHVYPELLFAVVRPQ